MKWESEFQVLPFKNNIENNKEFRLYKGVGIKLSGCISQPAEDVRTTSQGRVVFTFWRRYNVQTTLFQRHVPVRMLKMRFFIQMLVVGIMIIATIIFLPTKHAILISHNTDSNMAFAVSIFFLNCFPASTRRKNEVEWSLLWRQNLKTTSL